MTYHQQHWREPFRKLARGAIELLCHTALLVLILIAVRVIEWTLERLWGTGEKLLFDVVPVRFLFDGADLGLILAFSVFRRVRCLSSLFPRLGWN
jgi:hypothetical protein